MYEVIRKDGGSVVAVLLAPNLASAILATVQRCGLHRLISADYHVREAGDETKALAWVNQKANRLETTLSRYGWVWNPGSGGETAWSF